MFQACLDNHPQILQLQDNKILSILEKITKKDISKLLNLFANDDQFSSLFNSKIEKYERWDKLGPKKNKSFKIDKNFIKHAKHLIKNEKLNAKNFFLSVLAYFYH